MVHSRTALKKLEDVAAALHISTERLLEFCGECEAIGAPQPWYTEDGQPFFLGHEWEKVMHFYITSGGTVAPERRKQVAPVTPPNYELRQVINESLKAIPYRAREVLKYAAGISDGYWYTTDEIAHVFKMSPITADSDLIEACAIFSQELSSRMQFNSHGAAGVNPERAEVALADFAARHSPASDQDFAKMDYESFDQLLKDFGVAQRCTFLRIGRILPREGELVAVSVSNGQNAFLAMNRTANRIEVSLLGEIAAIHRGESRMAGIFARGNGEATSHVRFRIVKIDQAEELASWFVERGIPATTTEFVMLRGS